MAREMCLGPEVKDVKEDRYWHRRRTPHRPVQASGPSPPSGPSPHLARPPARVRGVGAAAAAGTRRRQTWQENTHGVTYFLGGKTTLHEKSKKFGENENDPTTNTAGT
jgi:hypothetical protein